MPAQPDLRNRTQQASRPAEQQTSKEVAVVDAKQSVHLIESYRTEFSEVLPSHVNAETFVRIAQGAIRKDEKLAKAAQQTPASLVYALREAARLGLEPGTSQFYLTPRWNSKTRMNEILGIVGYQGEIELMYRAGAVSSVIVEAVRRNDTFRYSPGRDERPVHEVDWFAEDRGELIGAYAYAVMKDGATSKVVVINKKVIEDAKRDSQGSDSQYSPWVKHEESMWLKTAAHRLTKWVPTSAEYRREELRAVAEVAREQMQDRPTVHVPTHTTPPPVVIASEVVDTSTGEVPPTWPTPADIPVEDPPLGFEDQP